MVCRSIEIGYSRPPRSVDGSEGLLGRERNRRREGGDRRTGVCHGGCRL